MYQRIESPAITRHFVNLGDRQVHVRLAGSGPPLVMLHQSPTSSAEMATEIESFAQGCTVIGIDMPGYGLSDPLPDEHPDIGQFARDVERVVTVLGLDRVLLSGFHTGAVVAFEFACRFPERTAGAVVNGLVCVEGEELEDLLEHYNVMPEVTVEGTHLPWLWARLRDQALFFPWYRKTPEARMTMDLHDGQHLQPYLLDFLRAKEGGRPGYQAAFSYPTRARMPRLAAPVYLVNFAADPLATHPERLPGLPDCVTRAVFDDFAELQQGARRFLAARAPGGVEIPRRSVGSLDGALRKEVVNTDAGPVFVRHSEPGDGDGILLLHDAGSSSSALASLARGLGANVEGRRQVVCIDLPGHGETGELQMPTYAARSIAILLGLVAQHFRIAAWDVVALGASTLIGARLAQSGAPAVGNLVLIDPWLFPADERRRLAATYAPQLPPGDFGQHLLEAWYFARDSELFWPWNEPFARNALARAPDLDPANVQARAFDALKAGSGFRKLIADLLAEDCDDVLASLDCAVWACARTGNGHEARAEAATRLNPRVRYRGLPADSAAWPDELAQMLKRTPRFGHNSASEKHPDR